MKLKYYNNLDGIRAIAALMVMIFHFFQAFDPNSYFWQTIKKVSVFGQTGVTLFFVLSGFLITRILINTKETEGYFKNFYLRRTLRIFPLYYLFLILSYFIVPYILDAKIPDFSQQIYYYLYLQNFASTFSWDAVGPSHFWSLAVEEHFYLFWPLVIYLFSRKNLIKIIIGIIVFALLLRIYMVNKDLDVFKFTFTRFDSLAIGAILAILELKNYFTSENIKKFVILLCGIFIPTITIWLFISGDKNTYIQIFKYLLISFTYFSLIGFILCLKNDHLINKFLRSRFLVYTGKISYGLYVYHPLAYALCDNYLNTNSQIINLLIRFTATYILAALSYHFFESAFLRLKKYFEYSDKRKNEKIERKLLM